ncbi:SDR family NAD(P)-dependent oxidoreductase [Amycolatopsis mongoliensis]|uniref:SDR family NAD(P)-dependent oxidoreductase n=1 Tax=Amycolatopsis mongoliensis TaxID=715475 RepID=A0A9Y2NKF0_9PSEU|nr:SDR family NAD(P)-dependent oxidoreductase [Amycolatopsis sp. 4-36]WIY01080.1 SDR family NAD(P)-dependent oxidoreductase [Amycolatopsis sp. 4-36]
MGIDFTGRVAVITGAGNGLGAEYARTLARLGAAVVVNDIGSSPDGTPDGTRPAEQVVEQITAAGGRAIANTDSVADPDGGRAIVEAAVKEFGRLDIVVNNAGNRRNAPIDEVTPQDFEAILAVHLKGALHVSQPAFAVMKEQGYGRLLFTSSSAGLFGNAGQASYAAAKAGVFGLAQALAIEGKPHGILANVLLPMAGTPRATAGMTAQANAAAGVQPEPGSGADTALVSALVAYLVSQESTLTHEVLASAGGRYYSAFVGTTPGWRHTGDQVPTPDEIGAHLEQIRSRSGHYVPDSLGADIAVSMPAALSAPQPARSPAEAARGYFDALLGEDADAIQALFAEDAVLDVPGTKLAGNAAITAFYRKLFTTGGPKPAPGPLLVDGDRVAVQIEVRYQGQDLRFADFFTVDNEGRLTRVVAYQAE